LPKGQAREAAILVSCVVAELGNMNIELVPTSSAAHLTYSESEMGFGFSFPDSWQLEQGDHVGKLQQGAATLRFDHACPDEGLRRGYFGRSGISAGDLR
jgi:hypothetical protein